MAEAAANVIGCPPAAVGQQVTTNPAIRVAQGCGRSAQLALQCNPIGCGWVPYGAPTQAAAPAPPAAPASYGNSGGSVIVYVPQQP